MTRYLIQKPTSSTRTNCARRRGVVILEAAATIVILLIMTLGLLQYGIIYYTTLSVQHTCRETARFAAVNGRNIVTTGTDVDGDGDSDVNDQTIVFATSVGRKSGLKMATQNNPLDAVFDNVVITGPSPNRSGVTNRAEFTQITIIINYDMSQRRIIPNTFFNIPIYSSTYSVSERVVLEGENPA